MNDVSGLAPDEPAEAFEGVIVDPYDGPSIPDALWRAAGGARGILVLSNLPVSRLTSP